MAIYDALIKNYPTAKFHFYKSRNNTYRCPLELMFQILVQNEFGAKPSRVGGRNKVTVVFGDLIRSMASFLSKVQ